MDISRKSDARQKIMAVIQEMNELTFTRNQSEVTNELLRYSMKLNSIMKSR
jgi:hypothetical protein